jgi:hypothetical protein
MPRTLQLFVGNNFFHFFYVQLNFLEQRYISYLFIYLPVIRNMFLDDRYLFVHKAKLCFVELGLVQI